MLTPTESLLSWMAEEAELTPRETQAFRLRRLHGYTFAAIAAEMGIREESVRVYVALAQRKIRARQDEEAVWTAEQVAAVLSTDVFVAETEIQHAAAVLDTMHGPPRPDPQAPLLDANGRKVANHDPVVDAREAAAAFGKGPPILHAPRRDDDG